MNFYELKGFRWLMNEYNLTEKDIKYNYNVNPDFITPVGNFEIKSLMGKSIVFTKKQVPSLRKVSNLKVLVFDTGDKPVFQIPFEEIDFEGKKWQDLNVYIQIPIYNKPVGLSERQYQMMHDAKDLFEADFGKKVSLGEFIAVLVQGYLEGRSIIEKHSEYVLTVTEG